MNFAKIIDQTNIKKDAKEKDILKTCQEAELFSFRGVCVRPKWTKLVARQLKGKGIKTIVLVDDPIGDSPHQKRLKICQKAKKEGADEIDIVICIPDIKHERWQKVLKDLKDICKILPTKVIIGSGYLTDEEIIFASKIVKKAGAFCVKTATDKDPLEHRELKEKFHHLKLMKESAPGLLIKASGKIQTLKDLKEALKAGADIIGTSFGPQIIKGLSQKTEVFALINEMEEKVLKILRENLKNENLVKHSLAVGQAMEELAVYFGEKKEKWKTAGILHDIDYEKTKNQPHLHSKVGAEMLRQLGFEEDICQAVLTHNEIHNLEPKSLMAKALFCLDPLTGLIVAATLVLPSKKIKDLTVENISNRFSEKSFARGANREIIKKATNYLGLPLERFFEITLKAMQKISDQLGL